MVELLKDKYWSKSDAFLLPLTGLGKNQRYKIKCYLFWDKYSIEDYQLILKISYENYTEFIEYCRKFIFPILDRNGYLVESYDFEGCSVFILDMSEWALDIEMLLKGSYSKFSKQAKDIITKYHTFYDNGPKILVEIKASLNPTLKEELLGNVTPLEYMIDVYGLPAEEVRRIGEVGGIYDKEEETLTYVPPKGDILSWDDE